MSLSVGVIGTGNIGTSHARDLSGDVAGASVTWVYDEDVDRAAAVAAEVGARVADDVEQLIEESEAVVIASPDAFHAEQATMCLDAVRPTLCEKPLAPTIGEARDVVDAEVAVGRRLITLGFMRRFDPGYQQLKGAMGQIGQPLLVHNVHRNAFAPYGLTSVGTLTNSAIHEIDINRWILDDDYETVQVLTGRPGPSTPEGEFDPLLVILTTRSGVLVEIEAFLNARYGYEVACQVVGSEGVLDLGDGSFVTRRAAGMRSVDVPELWLGRFADAYRRELQAWVDGVRHGVAVGASAWDGLVATTTANAAAASILNGPQVISLPEKPALYGAG